MAWPEFQKRPRVKQPQRKLISIEMIEFKNKANVLFYLYSLFSALYLLNDAIDMDEVGRDGGNRFAI